MWHSVKQIAIIYGFNVDNFIEFAKKYEEKYHLIIYSDNIEVATWNYDDLIRDFKSYLTKLNCP